jgi:hypothetical protein
VSRNKLEAIMFVEQAEKLERLADEMALLKRKLLDAFEAVLAPRTALLRVIASPLNVNHMIFARRGRATFQKAAL